MKEQTDRSYIMEELQKIFKGKDKTHGMEHALAVDNTIIKLIKDPFYQELRNYEPILRIAGLMHDIGYTRQESSWNPGKVEHVEESIKIFIEKFSKMEYFSNNQTFLELVCYLILRHDDTNYSYPINSIDSSRTYTPSISSKLIDFSNLKTIEPKVLNKLVQIVREADALQGTGDNGAIRTRNYSFERALPLVSSGNPLNSYAWEESVISNIRLAAKRALIDVRTKGGRESATKGYDEAEKVVLDICHKNNLAYEPEFGVEYIGSSVVRGDIKSQIKLISYRNWHNLKRILRQVTLKGDNLLFPYAAVKIESKLISISQLSPLAKYALNVQLDFQKELFSKLMKNYGINIFDLSGIIDFEYKNISGLIRLAPPIVEECFEDLNFKRVKVYALVDGLHRTITAKNMGFEKIRVIQISNVAKQFPLVPLPLKWSMVKEVDDVPNTSRKREFRIGGLDELRKLHKMYPNAYSDSVVPEDDLGAKYFTYRDLSVIGSDGIRFAKHHADEIIIRQSK